MPWPLETIYNRIRYTQRKKFEIKLLLYTRTYFSSALLKLDTTASEDNTGLVLH